MSGSARFLYRYGLSCVEERRGRPNMLGDSALMAFVSSTDLARARAFYEGVLGLTVQGVDDYACVLLAGGTTLRVTRVDELSPQPFTVLGWIVPDVRAMVTS